MAQKGLDEQGVRWAQLRVSEGLSQNLFETVLGRDPNEQPFSLSRIRNFEVFLLERFSRIVLNAIIPAMLKKPGQKAPPPEYDAMMHMVWLIEGITDAPQMMVLTVPQACIKTRFEIAPPATETAKLDPRFLENTHPLVHLKIGSTAASLKELRQIEPGDWLLLENSQLDQWALKNPITHQWMPFAVSLPLDPFPSERRVDDFESQQGNTAMSQHAPTQSPTDLWDNLPVEVTASFNPVKMPLKQLKEIEQGLVMEVGGLMDNRITIEVEGQAVAWGELLVLGDKFGVRIMGIHQAPQSFQPSGNTDAPKPTSAAPETNQSAPANPDLSQFDESDFDDDDEDWT